MSKIGELQGTPWHVEKMARKEGDSRRHRSRCIHYSREDKHCNMTGEGCWGAGHCSHYNELDNDDTLPVPRNQIQTALYEFKGMIKTLVLIELGYHVDGVPSTRNVKSLLETLIYYLNLRETQPNSSNVRYIIMAIIKNHNYTFYPAECIDINEIINCLHKIEYSTNPQKKYELQREECEIRIQLVIKLLTECKTVIPRCSQIDKKGQMSDFCVKLRDVQKTAFNIKTLQIE